jgi:hypothetical protein
MLQRLMPLVLALVVGASPIARELCVAACAEPATASAGSRQAHHGAGHSMADHEMPAHHAKAADVPPTPGIEMSASRSSDERDMEICRSGPSIGSSAACHHGGEWQPAAALTAKPALSAPAAPRHVANADPPGLASSASRGGSFARPPVSLALHTPLRV